jgi:hypothetical protein
MLKEVSGGSKLVSDGNTEPHKRLKHTRKAKCKIKK